MDKITVIEQRTTLLYDAEVIAVRADDGQVYASLSQMCAALDLDRTGQVRRIQRHAVLSQGYKGGDILSPPSATGGGGNPQSAGLLRVDLIPLWLTGIQVAKVAEPLREKLEFMQANAARVLWEAFQSGELSLDVDFQSLMKSADSDTVQAYLIARAVYKLASQQLALESRVNSFESRLSELEASATDGRSVTQDQAMQISQAIKTIAIAQGKISGRNEFGATYGELYRRFGITSYKLAPANKFSEIMMWLNEWWVSVSDDEWPF